MKNTAELWTTFAQRQQALYPRLHRLLTRWEEFFPLDYGRDFNPSLGDYQRSQIDWEDFKIEYEHQLWSYTDQVAAVEDALVQEVNFIALRTLLSWLLEETPLSLDDRMDVVEAKQVRMDVDLPSIVTWTNNAPPVQKWALTEATAPLEWHLVYLMAWWFNSPNGLTDWTGKQENPYRTFGWYYLNTTPVPEWPLNGKEEDVPRPTWMWQMANHVIFPRRDEERRVGHPLETLFPPLAL